MLHFPNWAQSFTNAQSPGVVDRFGKKRKTKMLRVGAQGVGAHGGCFQDLETILNQICSGSVDVDLRSSFPIFHSKL